MNHLSKRSIRVFISSTFIDMNSERDYLINKIFPKIADYCKCRGIEFTPLDLRWGITEEDAKQGRVIQTCLEEVDNSRPYFIGIVGNRYGWAPKKEDFGTIYDDLSIKYPWIDGAVKENMSITEMEMQYAALKDHNIDHALFYLRSSSMKVNDSFYEIEGSEPDKKLAELKNKIKSQAVYPVSEYNSPETLGDKIYDQLIGLIDADFPKVDDIELQHIRHTQSQAEQAEGYINGENYVANIERWLVSDNKLMVVNGEYGVGKSALIAHFIETHKDKIGKHIYVNGDLLNDNYELDPSITFFAVLNNELGRIVGINTTERKQNLGCILSFVTQFFKVIFCSIIFLFWGVFGNMDKARKWFSGVFSSTILFQGIYVAKKHKKILKRIAKDKNSQYTIWIDNFDILPLSRETIFTYFSGLPKNIKVIATSTNSSPIDTTFRLELNSDETTVEKFNNQELLLFINKHLEKYSKQLSAEQANTLVSCFYTSSPKIMSIILQQLVRYGSFESLNKKIESLSKIRNIDELSEYVIHDLINEFIDTIGYNAMVDALIMLSICRNGLSENEIKNIGNMTPIAWSMVRSHVLELCTCVGGSYRIKLTPFIKAIHNIISNKQIEITGLKCINYFENLFDYQYSKPKLAAGGASIDYGDLVGKVFDNKRQAEELPYLYMYFKKKEKLLKYCTYITNNSFIKANDRIEYWSYLYQEGYNMRGTTLKYNNEFEPSKESIISYYTSLADTANICNNIEDTNWATKQISRLNVELAISENKDLQKNSAEAKEFLDDLNKDSDELNEILEVASNIKSLFLTGKYNGIVNLYENFEQNDSFDKDLLTDMYCLSLSLMGQRDKAISIAKDFIERCKESKELNYLLYQAVICYADIISKTSNIELLNDAERRIDTIYDQMMQKGLNDPYTLRMFNSLALISLQKGEYQKAIKLFKDVRNFYNDNFSSNSFNYYTSQSNLALALIRNKNVDEGLDCFKDVIFGLIKINNPSLSFFLWNLDYYVAVLIKHNRFEEAIDTIMQCLKQPCCSRDATNSHRDLRCKLRDNLVLSLCSIDAKDILVYEKRAIDSGCAEELYCAIGLLYGKLGYRGLSFNDKLINHPDDINLATAYLERSAKGGYTKSYYYLSEQYIAIAEEQGFTEDLCDNIRRTIKSSAENNNIDSFLTIGNLFHFGKCYNKNIDRAIEWYKKSAQCKDYMGAASVAITYFEEYGNAEEALPWVDLAEELGWEDAKEYREKLSHR